MLVAHRPQKHRQVSRFGFGTQMKFVNPGVKENFAPQNSSRREWNAKVLWERFREELRQCSHSLGISIQEPEAEQISTGATVVYLCLWLRTCRICALLRERKWTWYAHGSRKVRDQDSRIHVSDVIIEDSSSVHTTSPKILEFVYSVKSESIILWLAARQDVFNTAPSAELWWNQTEALTWDHRCVAEKGFKRRHDLLLDSLGFYF